MGSGSDKAPGTAEALVFLWQRTAAGGRPTNQRAFEARESQELTLAQHRLIEESTKAEPDGRIFQGCVCTENNRYRHREPGIMAQQIQDVKASELKEALPLLHLTKPQCCRIDMCHTLNTHVPTRILTERPKAKKKSIFHICFY